MGRQPTIKDVAKLAGVSISTVSRVMNDSKPVSPEARKKVIDAINKLDFKPNELARSLVMKKSNLIGIVVKDIGIEYMAQIIRGIEEIGRMYKYDIILSSTYGEAESEEKAIDFLATKQVEGIIVLSEDVSAESLVKLRDYRIPFILLDKFYNFKNLKTVTIDYLTEQYNLVKFLNKLGHEKIGFVSPTNSSVVSEKKLAGYKKAMQENDAEEHVIFIDANEPDTTYNSGDKIMKYVREHNLTALCAVNDYIAIGFINYCYDKSIDVPEDISVAGFGDCSLASIYRPKLTTVQQPYYDIGAVAVRSLIKRLSGDDQMQEDYIIPAQIMERESTKRL